MSDRKSSDDVEQLLRDKRLGDLQYREFTPSHAARLTLADGKAKAPEVNLPPADVAPVTARPAMTLPDVSPRVAPVAGLPGAGTPRATVHESPLNFTFERLRRQVIAARSGGPLLALQLAPRQRAHATLRLERLQQRTLADVFNALAQASSTRRHGS